MLTSVLGFFWSKNSQGRVDRMRGLSILGGGSRLGGLGGQVVVESL